MASPDHVVITPDASRSGRPNPCGTGCEGAHCYTSNGRRLCWRPGTAGTFAIDAELLGQEVAEVFRRRWNGSAREFWVAWTRAEVCAKLTDTPILVWVQHHGLRAPLGLPVRVVHAELDGLTVCFGARTG
jgi:hypothetical protein